MEWKEILASPAVVAIVSGILAGAFALLGAWAQSRSGREVERHRFRHDIGALTAQERLRAHVEIARKLTEAYRKKMNQDGDPRKALNDAKNFYYDNRFFFSSELGKALALFHDRWKWMTGDGS